MSFVTSRKLRRNNSKNRKTEKRIKNHRRWRIVRLPPTMQHQPSSDPAYPPMFINYQQNHAQSIDRRSIYKEIEEASTENNGGRIDLNKFAYLQRKDKRQRGQTAVKWDNNF
nr:hypothetical protein Iba_chr14fCG10420 [Ipomoea batatas]